jgi:Glycosyl hydrolase 108
MQCRGAYGAWRVLTRYCVNNPLMLNMTPDDAKAYAKAFYEKEYWDALACDDLPAPLDAICFDTAVNPGPTVARKILNETRDWKDFLFERLLYYSTDVQAHPEKAQFFRGWVNRCLTLWGKNNR